MEKNSKSAKILLEAVNKGYFVNKDGDVYGVRKKILSCRINKAGYKSFSIRYNKERNTMLVHQLQAYQKFGDMIFEYFAVRHLDGNCLNNSIDNIELGTHQDNMLDISPVIRKSKAKYASSFKHRFTEKEVLDIWKDRQDGMKYSDICEKYNTSKSTLSHFFNKCEYVQEILLKNKVT